MNWLHKIFASCMKGASEEPVYKAAALVYVGHHVTSRNTVWPEYIDFSQQSKDGPFFVFKQISLGFAVGRIKVSTAVSVCRSRFKEK